MRNYGVLLLAVQLALQAMAAEPPPTAPFKAPAKVPKTGIGFLGDGTGVFPDSKPPTTWDEKTGKNIRWRVELPSWCDGSPVPVGNRVFVMNEPGLKDMVFPLLQCYDADTGKLLWSKVVDPFDAFPDLAADQRKALTADVAWVQENLRDRYRIIGELLVVQNAASKGPDSPEMKAALAEMAKVGWEVKNPSAIIKDKNPQAALGGGCSRLPETKKKIGDINKRLAPYGVVSEGTWDQCGRSRIGQIFLTPVSDGQALYVQTVHGTVACYDLDGSLRWMQRATYQQNIDLVCSPRLCGDTLLTAVHSISHQKAPSMLFAWDKRTGQQLWKVALERDLGYRTSSLAVMTLGTTDVVLTPCGQVVRVADGKALTPQIPFSDGWAMDDQHDAVFVKGKVKEKESRFFGLELAIDGEGLKIKERFALDTGGTGYMLFTDGKVYGMGRKKGGDGMYDAATGLLIRKCDSLQSCYQYFAAGGHVYGLKEEGTDKSAEGWNIAHGACYVTALDGKAVATNLMTIPPWEGDRLKKWISLGRYMAYYNFNLRQHFSQACPMNIGGDRLYFRSDDFLYCIGEK